MDILGKFGVSSLLRRNTEMEKLKAENKHLNDVLEYSLSLLSIEDREKVLQYETAKIRNL